MTRIAFRDASCAVQESPASLAHPCKAKPQDLGWTLCCPSGKQRGKGLWTSLGQGKNKRNKSRRTFQRGGAASTFLLGRQLAGNDCISSGEKAAPKVGWEVLRTAVLSHENLGNSMVENSTSVHESAGSGTRQCQNPTNHPSCHRTHTEPSPAINCTLFNCFVKNVVETPWIQVLQLQPYKKSNTN